MKFKDLSVAALRVGYASYQLKDTFHTMPLGDKLALLGIDRERLYKAYQELEAIGFVHIEREKGKSNTVTLLDQYGHPVLFGRVEQGVIEPRRDTSILSIFYPDTRTKQCGDTEPEQVCGPTNGCALPPTSTIQETTTPLETDRSERDYPPPKGLVLTPSEGTTPLQGDYPVRGLPPTEGTGLHFTEVADDMDDSGDVMLKNSPAQLRRKEQVKAVVKTFHEEFPGEAEFPLSPETAKGWLRACGNSATEVRAQIRGMKRWKDERGERIESPRSYITYGIASWKAKMEKLNQIPSTTSRTSVDHTKQEASKEPRPDETQDDPAFHARIEALNRKIEESGKMPAHYR